MNLLVDIGNSRMKWALTVKSEREAQGVAAHSDAELADFFTAAWAGLAAPQRILVANVAGKKMATALRAWVKSAWGKDVEILVPRRKAYGVTNAYVEAQQLGADRWAALIGARQVSAGNVCIIDCGTAVTIDALDTKGQHLGGLIIPGLTMMRQAVIQDTGIAERAVLPGDGKVSVLARDTSGAVNGGVLYSLIALIDRVSSDLATELPGPMARLICGGDAERVLPLLAGSYRYEPNLVLQGLAVIAESTK